MTLIAHALSVNTFPIQVVENRPGYPEIGWYLVLECKGSD